MRKNRALCFAAAALLAVLFSAVPLAVLAAPVSAGEAVLDAESGRVLFSRNAHMQMPMASTTKILTAVLILEDCCLDDLVRIPPEAAGVEGSSVYLKAGETLSVRDLLYGLLLRSGNDCAVALALHHSGSVEKFAARMNERAVQIGAEHSCFVNPHGLPADGHYTTALDLARITAYALHDPVFCSIVSAEEWKTQENEEGEARLFKNKNKMLWEYEGACGVKTGYTKQAGRCLVTAARKEGMLLVCCVLNSPSMYERSAELLDAAYEKYERVCLFDANGYTASVPAGGKRSCRCGCEKSFYYPLTEQEKEEVRTEVRLEPRLPLPVRRGDAAGDLRIYLSNQLLFSEKIVSIEDIERSFFDILREIGKSR